MNQKWNLQDIRPAEPRRKKSAPSKHTDSTKHTAVDKNVSSSTDASSESIPIKNGKKKKTYQTITILGFLIFFVTGTVAISYLMRGADVEVHPRTQQPNLNATITSYPESRPNELAYELLVLDAEAERQVSATGEVEEQTRAAGEIEIFNENSSPQRLVANTRFESPDGNIYRIADEVTVPGATQSDSETTPGSLMVSVEADSVGEDYNIADTVRLTIPGFAEGGFTDLYATVYAENVEPITGGFSGTRLQIEDSERKIARQELQMELRETLRRQTDEARPAEFIYYPNSVVFMFEELPAVEYGNDMATIKERALMFVPLFNEQEFASFLAEATITGYQKEPIRLDNPDELSFAYEGNVANSDMRTLESIEFTITGRPKLVWTFDEDELRNTLLQEHKNSLHMILDQFESIEYGEAQVQPFWQRNFPSEPELINIVEVID